MSAEQTSPEELRLRMDQLARSVRRLRVITCILVIAVSLFIVGLFIPEVPGALVLQALIAAILFGMLLFISSVMGLLEWWSPSGRLDEQSVTMDHRST